MVTIVNDDLLIVRLSGIIDSGAALALARELNRIEAAGAYSKRIVFVDENLSVALKSGDVMLYKSLRLEPQTVTKTAFCVFTDLQYGIARMFQALLESENHEINIFRDRESAAQWLAVDIDLVREQSD
ncbi:MAG: hypothetical protein JW832_18200 [Deltaproteobacteria bacterium]|nr:hypothetical protein [Deltaproteobacteria bacterium]